MAEENSTEKKKEMIYNSYKYHIETFEIFFDGIEKPVRMEKGSVNNMVIEKIHDKYYWPLFQLNCIMNPKLHEFIIFNKNTVRFRIRLQCDIMDNEGNIVSVEDMFNDFFIPLIGEEKPFYDHRLYEETVKIINGTDVKTAESSNMGFSNLTGDAKEAVSFYLYKADDLIKGKTPVNEVFSGNNMTNVLVNLLANAGFNKIMISPCDNNGEFSEVIIPLMNLIKAFGYLEDNYGIYDAGATVFFDYRCVYILDKNGHPNCYEEEEYKKTIFSIHETKSSDHKTPGTFSIDEDKEYHIYVEPHRVQIMNFSVYNDHIFGNNLMTVDANNNSMGVISGTGEQRGGGVYKITQNSFSNSYAKKKYANDVSDSNMRLKLTLFDVYEKALTPNKEFVFNFVDSRIKSDYNGYYRLCSNTLVFSRSGNFFDLSAQCEFAKKEDISEAEKKSIDKKVAPVYTKK